MAKKEVKNKKKKANTSVSKKQNTNSIKKKNITTTKNNETKVTNVNIVKDNSIKKRSNKKKKTRRVILMSILFTLLFLLFICSIILNVILYNKKNKIETVYKFKNDENIVFYGDSITSKYEIENFFPKNKIINSGRSGDIASDLIERINDDVYKYNPSKVFILIGINDLTRDVNKDEILTNIQEIITGIKIHRKHCKIYIESIYPINRSYMDEKDYEFNDELDNDDIIEFNKEIKKIAENNNITYIDVFDSLLDEDGNLNRDYSKEGLHLNDIGYLKVSETLEKYIKEK